MNVPQEQFIATGKSPTQTDRLIQVLHEAGGEWVSLTDLVAAGCGYATHSRAADARKMGCNVENKVEYSQLTKLRHSWYRMLPPT